jgi:glycerol-3-phosphate dehydrogenase (NAD(P)+)
VGEVGRCVDVDRELGIDANLDGARSMRRGVLKVAFKRVGAVARGDRCRSRERHHVGAVPSTIGYQRYRVPAGDLRQVYWQREVSVRDDHVLKAGPGHRGHAIVDSTVEPKFCGPQCCGAQSLRPITDTGVVADHEHSVRGRGSDNSFGHRHCQPDPVGGCEYGTQSLFRFGECLDGHEHGDVHRAECRKPKGPGHYGRRLERQSHQYCKGADREIRPSANPSITTNGHAMTANDVTMGPRPELTVGVIGAGSWGTTVAAMTCGNATTQLWARRPDLADEINTAHTNSTYLPSYDLPHALRASSSLDEVVSASDVIVMAVPSHGYREVAREVAISLRPWVPVVTLSKGLERESRQRMSQVTEEEMPGHPVAVLTGPNLAKEIMSGQPAASVVAIDDQRIAAELQRLFSRPSLRVYTNRDIVGCEVAGVVKNVIAIAAGMAQGMGFGDNTLATLITRGLAEMSRLGEELGGDPATFAGLAGMGDLIATCASTQSRNNTVGRRLGQGETIGDIVSSMKMVAEGVKSCPSVLELAADAGVEMPITEQVVAVCHEGRVAKDALAQLMDRDSKSEVS